MKFSRTQIIITGLVFHILAAIFSVGYHHCDELFQVYEFAGYKLGINSPGDLPWEFHSQMRSGIQPLIVYCFTKLAATFSINDPFVIAAFIRIVISLLSFCAIFLFTRHFEVEAKFGKDTKHLWFLALMFWCLPYFHARFSSENFSASLFLIGVLPFLRKPLILNCIGAGILFGLAFIIRFQMAFMVAGFFAWLLFINKTQIKYIGLCIIGIIISLGAGMLVDEWLYGNWTLSWWNYLDQNLFHDKASRFGTEPFYFYFTESLLQLLPPFSLVIVSAVLYFWWRFPKHVITWITIPFILLHCLVAHKELRFLFPVLNFLPLILILVYHSFQTSSSIEKVLKHNTFTKLFVTVNLVALLVFTFKPADEISFSLKKIYETLPEERSILLYENDDPYGNAAALNFFRKKNVHTRELGQDSLLKNGKLFYFSRSFSSPDIVDKGGQQFEKIYASYPQWFSKLNFNDWQSRSFSFSIYQLKR